MNRLPFRPTLRQLDKLVERLNYLAHALENAGPIPQVVRQVNGKPLLATQIQDATGVPMSANDLAKSFVRLLTFATVRGWAKPERMVGWFGEIHADCEKVANARRSRTRATVAKRIRKVLESVEAEIANARPVIRTVIRKQAATLHCEIQIRGKQADGTFQLLQGDWNRFIRDVECLMLNCKDASLMDKWDSNTHDGITNVFRAFAIDSNEWYLEATKREWIEMSYRADTPSVEKAIAPLHPQFLIECGFSAVMGPREGEPLLRLLKGLDLIAREPSAEETKGKDDSPKKSASASNAAENKAAIRDALLKAINELPEGKNTKSETIIRKARVNRNLGLEVLHELQDKGLYQFAKATPARYRKST